jgi:hypothetical protein
VATTAPSSSIPCAANDIVDIYQRRGFLPRQQSENIVLAKIPLHRRVIIESSVSVVGIGSTKTVVLRGDRQWNCLRLCAAGLLPR